MIRRPRKSGRASLQMFFHKLVISRVVWMLYP
uniref:Uncharacterized protein n=1 Tax=Steinernema glaseri TaxID=37863 RepID=A0A1I7YVH9_9BILA